jgi:hypothetical protein
MNKRLKDDKNPIGNCGAIFEKVNATSSYFLIKVTIGGQNNTLVAFKNRDHSGEEYSKEPLYFIFPYKPKEQNGNGQTL